MFKINKLALVIFAWIVYLIAVNSAISNTVVLGYLHIKKDISSGPVIIPLAVFLNVLPLGVFYWWYKSSGKKIELHRKKLLETGRKAEATVINVQDTGMTVNQNPYIKISLRVKPEFGSEFEVTVKQLVSRLAIPKAGDKLQIVFDPQNTNDLIISS